MPLTSHRAREALLLLTDAARLLRTHVDRRAAEHGMTRAQWGALIRIGRRSGITQAEIAEQMEIQPISLVPVLDRLCEQGLIERQAHPSDRRAKLLRLTPKGEKVLLELEPLAVAIAEDLFAGATAEQIEDFHSLLELLKDNIKRATDRQQASAK
ncbi:MAG: MarR family transcriptional regulator [Hyphomicrobiaceae bacterium]